MDKREKSYWVICPKCGGKTKSRIYEDTVMLNYPLYCPKCKKETLVNIVKLKTVIISEEPDEWSKSLLSGLVEKQARIILPGGCCG